MSRNTQPLGSARIGAAHFSPTEIRAFTLFPARARFSYRLNVDTPSKPVYRQTAVDFIVVELDLAVTFCQVALSTDNPASASRNIENAKRALQAALIAAQRLEVRPRDKRIFEQKTLQVNSLLIELARNGRKC